MRKGIHVAATVLIGLSVLLTGCDLTGASNEIEGEGRFRLLLTDAPADVMLEANVTIERIELMDTTGTAFILLDEPVEYDLLQLQNGATAVLADTLVPLGAYSQIRVIVNEDAHVVWDDLSTSTLKIPSGPQTGIKIVGFQALEIDDDDDSAEVMLDFDAGRSFVEAGNSGKVIFKPVIKVKSLELNDIEIEVDEEDEDGDTDDGEPVITDDLNTGD